MGSSSTRSLPKVTICCIAVLLFLSCFSFTTTEAYDAVDPNGNITIKWDVISWTPDGYVAVVTLYNFQKHRPIRAPGWTLGWSWARKEVIWSMVGAQTTEQGDCSRYKGNIPHSCKKTPTVVDRLPGTPYNQQIANCCKGGVVAPNDVSSFQISVGAAGNTNRTVKLPVNFTLLAPGPGYTCGFAKLVKPTLFITPDGRRTTRALKAYDPLDPNGNITIKWDVISWTPDGYVAVVTLFNFQQYRHIQAPGWTLGWSWAKKEVIWSMVGAQTTEQGDCSRYKGNVPHCCKKTPTVVDLLPGTPYNQQIANCCKGGVINSFVQDPSNAASSFQVSVGAAGTTNKTVRVPRNFTLLAPGPGYTCGPAKIVKATKFFTQDGRRTTQAMMTWNVTCTYSQFLAQKTPSCCVSLSSFYNDTIVPCPTCTCGCQNTSHPGSCVDPNNAPHLASVVPANGKTTNLAPLVQCTSHMCPIRVHWHVKLNYKEYWRVKVTITNFNYRMNYSQWNLVVQHPNFDNLTQIFSFNYKSLTPYEAINDTAMLWGVKFYNDFLEQAGQYGNVQSELLFRKDKNTFTFDKGWAFPRRIYFNGDNCVMPPPDSYPYLPNASSRHGISAAILVGTLLSTIAFFFGCL
ncbi:OLC1v1009795C1 [Oldenlandia corymbosa var. corymbosa]|uniref:OLC1v1009795C1 n=1 Tax=Oldenlandia corymbosa var. corymbosa TaxID=529605 RepID=A0AAV1DSR9_OLDCO|nr:OLC1v1009795C1 [Oldenlandia corymbosa var. corymbosa]